MTTPRTLVAIRCQGYTPEVERIAGLMRQALPEAEMVFVSDQRTAAHLFPADRDVLPLTTDALDRLGLFHARGNVGWICGDYCLYRALELDWDFLWLVEPDVTLSGGALTWLHEVDDDTADLITTGVTERPADWTWAAPLRATTSLGPEVEIAGMVFPLLRVSRRLAEATLRDRQHISERLSADASLVIPNDESVVATVARANQLTVRNLRAEAPEAFRTWSIYRPQRPRVALASPEVMFAHPTVTGRAYLNKLTRYLGGRAYVAVRGLAERVGISLPGPQLDSLDAR